jgi:hypothetical protein
MFDYRTAAALQREKQHRFSADFARNSEQHGNHTRESVDVTTDIGPEPAVGQTCCLIVSPSS